MISSPLLSRTTTNYSAKDVESSRKVEYFVNGEEIAMYDSVEDAYAQADYYLEHDDIRCNIARRGLEKVSREFSYRDRVNDMLRISGLS